MKKVIIAHCWDGTPNYCWYPDVKKEMESRGYEVIVPALPDTSLPELSKWLPALREAIGTPDQNTYLVGHSAGCITILRYLEALSPDQKIGGVVFVAGFTNNLGFTELENFFETPIDFEKIKTHCQKFVVIHSTNDPYVAVHFADVFKEKLDAKVIIKENMFHFSGPVDNEQSCLQLPEVVDSLLQF